MRIVVTGAASPLGRAVIAELVQRGHRAVGVVRRVSGVKLMENLGAEPFAGDVRKPDAVARAMVGADAVYHLAGFFDFWEPSSGVYDAVNVGATRNVLAAALLAKVKRVVLCSSALTIGERLTRIGRTPGPIPPTRGTPAGREQGAAWESGPRFFRASASPSQLRSNPCQ